MMKHALTPALMAALLFTGTYVALQPADAQAQYAAPSQPVVTDTRIRTLVYNPNEVYPLVSHYGFQSNIEFGPKEEIETISLGDQVSWQVIPSGRHLFLRAMTYDSRTNMTIITNERIYQFDLISPAKGARQQDDSYVVRFYYPSENWDQNPNFMQPGGNMQPSLPDMPAIPATQMQAPPPPMMPPMMPPAGLQPMMGNQPGQPFPAPPPGGMQGNTGFPAIPPTQMQQFNQNYTLSGPEQFAPTKIYDDGRNTYFAFRPTSTPPQVFVVMPDGTERPIQVSFQGDLMVVPTVQPRFSLRAGEAVVCIFNESM